MLKKIGIALAVVVVVLVAAVLLAPRLIDWNDYKPEIAAAVREATGRELAIEGDIDISIFPGAQFVASDVRLSNAEGTEPPNMVTVRRIEGSIRLLPLIGGNLVVDRLVIHEPVVALRVNEQGEANWVFTPQNAGDPVSAETPPSEEGSPVGDVQLDNVRIEGGVITFVDARTGQEIEARDLSLAASLPSMSEPLSITGDMAVNGEPVSLAFGLTTPALLMAGERAALTAGIESQRLKMNYDGGVQREPVPGLDGTFDLDIPSAGELAAWLDRPLPQGQPDPGPVRAHAVFAADGAEVAIREATLQGEALQAEATGVLDISGDAPRLTLKVESGVLDIDRYLPRPVQATAAQTSSRPAEARGGPDFLAEVSEEPFDLTALRNGSADVRVAIEGIRAAGYEVGSILFVATLEGGVLKANLQELNLYGGGVTGDLTLDASQDAMAMETKLEVAGVRTGELGAAVTGGESPVRGTVSADLAVQGQGTSPRALVESLNGRLAVDLGGLDLGAAAPGAISGLKVNLELPGMDSSPRLAGSVVYNKERVDFEGTLDPLPVVMSAQQFALDMRVASKPVSMAYEGAVLREPVAGLDGTFELAVPSVGRLASWLGTPLAANQPDPGPLKARAVFAGEGGRVTIEQAVIEGDGLKAEASGSWAQDGDLTKLVLDARAGVIDLDRYLPRAAAGAEQQTRGGRNGGLLASLSNEPLDLSALRSLNADVDLALQGLKVSGQEIGNTVIALNLGGGALKADIQELAAYGGSLRGQASLDASGRVPSYAVALNATNVDLGPALRGPDGAPPSVQGSVTANIEAQGSGASPRALAAATKAEVELRSERLLLDGETPRQLEQVALTAEIPGLDNPVAAEGAATYAGEKVAVAVQLDPIGRILNGERFSANVTVDSAPLKAQYEGAVQQQPVAGLDGKLSVNVPAVGRLMSWIGQPLPSGQPEPGPLEVNADLAADGPTVALRQASVTGKALRATANASYDGSAATPRIQARLDIEQADLDAYLPASGGAGQSRGPAGSGGSGGWSTEPIDLGILSAANADVQVNVGSVRYRGLEFGNGRVAAQLTDGTLNAALDGLGLADGTVSGNLAVGSAKGASIDYDLTVSGVEARPLLQAFADTRRLSGRTEFTMRGSARGANQRELVSNLNGQGDLHFFDGAIYGVNLAALLRQVGSLGLQGGEEQKTDFAELGGSFTIKSGLFENRDFKMLAPLVRLSGGGTANLPARTIDYRVEAKLVASLQGQGGDEALAGLPVPIVIGGTFDNPSYQVDWKSVLQSAASDPERLQKMPADLLGAAQELGVNLKGLGGAGGLGDVLKSLPGGGGAGQPSAGSQPSLPLDPLRQLFGGGRSGSAPAGAPAQQPSAAPEQAPAQEGTAAEAPEAPSSPEQAPAGDAPAPGAQDAQPASPSPEQAPAPEGAAPETGEAPAQEGATSDNQETQPAQPAPESAPEPARPPNPVEQLRGLFGR